MDNAASGVTADLATKFGDNANRAIAGLIDKVTAGMDQATSFLASQIPDVLHQLLVYNFAVSLIQFVVFLLIVLTIISFAVAVIRYALKQGDLDEDDWGGLALVVAFSGLLVFVDWIIFFDGAWLKIWLAPKIWLIEYAANLIKTATGH